MRNVIEKGLEEGCGLLRARAGGCRAADAGLGERGADAGDGVVVEFEVLRHRAVPVADVGFVPDLEVPLRDLRAAVALDQMRGEDAAELTPGGEVLRWALYASLNRVRIREVVGIRAGGERLGHEAELDHGANAGIAIRIECLVDDAEVVDGLSGCVERVDVGRAPLESRLAVTAGEEVMRADIDRNRIRVVQLGEKRAAVRRGGVVQLVVAEPRGDGLPGANRMGEIDVNCDRRLRGGSYRGGREKQKQNKAANHGAGLVDNRTIVSLLPHPCRDKAAP